MLKISDDFFFRRKHFVDDLSNPATYIKGSGLVVTNIEDLIATLAGTAGCSFDAVEKVAVVARDAHEVQAALSINPHMRPFMIILMSCGAISKPMLDAFHPVDRCAVGIICDDYNPAEGLINMINRLDSQNFKDFQMTTYGYVFTKIEHTDTIISRYSEGFIADPFWCVVHADWNYSELADALSISELSTLLYQCRFISANLLARTEKSPSTGRMYKFDYYRSRLRKELFLSEKSIAFFNPGYAETRVVFSVMPATQNEIAQVRKFYDTKLPVSEDSFSLATPVQNHLATGSPAVTPEWLHLIEDALRGGRR